MSDDASTMMEDLARNMATKQAMLERCILELCGAQAKSDYTINHELYNARKRRLNAGIHSPYAPLHILVRVSTGEPIQEFPLNVAAISTMTVARIRPIMAALNNPLPDDSGEDASQRLFRMEIGLTAEPVNFESTIGISV